MGRQVAHAQGWYEPRHSVQFGFIVAVGLAGSLSLTVLTWLSWPLSVGRKLALTGSIFLASFVLVRAAFFNHVDVFLSQIVLGLRWNWILEFSGIGLVWIGAIIENRTWQSQD